MEQGPGAAAATHGDVVERAKTKTDAIQEVAAIGSAGDAAHVVARSVAAAANLEEKGGGASSDSAVPDLAGDKQVVEMEEEAAGMKRKLAKTGFKSPYDSGYDDDDVYEGREMIQRDALQSMIQQMCKMRVNQRPADPADAGDSPEKKPWFFA
ncbi:hypothetical protein ZWY2020_039455 [Hordeum vulgare]|nr:hypothetical protein ZWY2020_039455 [Hordeum vulgare]